MFPYLLVTIGSGVSVLKVLFYVPIPTRNNRIRSISTKGIILCSHTRHIRISTKGIVIELFILLLSSFNLH